ncbi:hypothetical protein FPZ43_06980 [Mucilaginibacter pallidiroseus]|uniref:Uncharacterized protein n=1 Tax=Mucilaginibacter pallidiroseus TaxID=2599295 RepID=A0A563UE22_9SPHI|nr:hypothetical protein [Mucilaginibacter pallidiroseus]TWR29602.1 hypothetical protein FPZ43_06980 [Mucilaginibacter pallidiroseus]
MKTLPDFKATMQSAQPDSAFSVQLKSLWYDGKGNWQQAHDLIDQLTDQPSAWVHAYLHRKEGDTWNADYWYRRASKARPAVSLDEEWEQLVLHFLQQ